MKTIKGPLLLLLFCSLTILTNAQSEKKKAEVIADSKEAKAEFMKADKEMKGLFEKAYGYVIFPNVGKGAVVVGGAAGTGVAYEGGKQIGMAKPTQLQGKQD
jgi:lipid-binding SYLF domain-containing protein